MPALATVLIVPGYTNSGPGHWQTLWQREHPEYVRVEQRDWDHPQRAEWVATLDCAITRTAGQIVLVAHSLGCMAIAHWAAQAAPEVAQRVAGALLVAPVDPDLLAVHPDITGFESVPVDRLPFRSIVVAGVDDPFASQDVARRLAEAWGSEFVPLGAVGHINTDAGFGPFPLGEELLASLLQSDSEGGL